MKFKFFTFIIFCSLNLSSVYSQCEFFENYTGIIATIAAGSTVGQSFEMNCPNGNNAFESITINHQAPFNTNGTLRIFEGETFTGTPQYEQSIYIAAQGSNVHETIILEGGTGSLMFEEGQMYTVTFVFDRHFRWNGRNNSFNVPARALWPNNGGTWVTHFDYFYKVGAQSIITDSDGDGIDDPDDECADTPSGEGVNADGCSCSQVTIDDNDPCTLDECENGVVTHTFQDADNDGVCDANDICAGGDDNTDNDGDGTPDFCDTDDDNDGIEDACDSEPLVDNYTYTGFEDLPESWKCGNNKVYICHNGNNPQTNCVNKNAVQAHLDHGDYLGPCTTCGGQNMITNPNSGSVNNSSHTEAVEMELFPNPAGETVNIHLHGLDASATMKIFDQFGRIVWTQQLEEQQHVIQLDLNENTFQNGVYLVTIQTAQGEWVTKRLVVAK